MGGEDFNTRTLGSMQTHFECMAQTNLIMCTRCQSPTEARRGCQRPWIPSYRQLWASPHGCWEPSLVLWKSRAHSYMRSHLSAPWWIIFKLKTGRPCKVSPEQLDRSARIHFPQPHLHQNTFSTQESSVLATPGLRCGNHTVLSSVQVGFVHFHAVWVEYSVCPWTSSFSILSIQCLSGVCCSGLWYFLNFMTDNRCIHWFYKFVDISFVFVTFS